MCAGAFFAADHDEAAFRCLRKRFKGSHPQDSLANIIATLGFGTDNGICPDREDWEIDRLLDELLDQPMPEYY